MTASEPLKTDGLETLEYADLQLLKHDTTAQLPQLDTVANAPERDPAVDAPEAVVSILPLIIVADMLTCIRETLGMLPKSPFSQTLQSPSSVYGRKSLL